VVVAGGQRAAGDATYRVAGSELPIFTEGAMVLAGGTMRWAAVVLITSLIFVAEGNDCFAQADNASAKQKTIICAKPIFPGLHRLTEMLADEPSKMESVTIVSTYLLETYCWATDRALTTSHTEKINEHCDMHSDTTHAEAPIFWETCRAN
jgi:hypothetical protein